MTEMTPHTFIRKWRTHALTERAAAQEHFIDLCRLVGHPTPAEDDPAGERFTFEKGVAKTGGGDGYADVWKRGCFAFEYKKRKRDLDEALKQLTTYAAALENPPLHVACDTLKFVIETRWTNTVVKKYVIDIEHLDDPEKLKILRAVFHDPEALKPTQTRASLTKEAADRFQTISDRLQHRNPDREAVAHFVNQLVFCFFANSVKLLPEGLLRKLLETASKRPVRSKDYFDKLFTQMESGGELDLTDIRWFNGGLFDGRRALRLEEGEIELLIALHSFRWDLIDPTIFGTLFERFLDPDKRAQIGAHYTDPEKIMMIVEPVVLRPLRAEWAAAKADIAAILSGKAKGRKGAPPQEQAAQRRDAFIDRLCALRILDPACGSGNFLYMALQAVKDLEWQVILDCEAMGLGRPLPRVSPKILHGIEINPMAAELARTVIWIGDIQWGIRNALAHRGEPILEKLDAIECRDALLAPASPVIAKSAATKQSTPAARRGEDGSLRSARDDGAGAAWVEAEWPEADFIVGNPPFLGGKKLRAGLGDATVERLFSTFAGKVPAEADLVCYWFVKAWDAITRNRAKRAGLVATNSIRGGANRRALDPIAEAGAIFEAWSDEPWIVDGAAVRVSLVSFGARIEGEATRLDGGAVERVHADLAGRSFDLTQAKRLPENAGVAFMGDTKGGAFDVPGKLARAWLAEPLNPNGRPNSDVLKPWINGLDVTRRPRDMWIVDFGWTMSEAQAALYASPFAHLREHVKPERDGNRRAAYRDNWWRHVEPRPAMWAAIRALSTNVEEARHGRARPGHPRRAAASPAGVDARDRPGHDGAQARRYLVTPRVAKHRMFSWIQAAVEADSQLIAIARDDDTTFGILHSRFHEAWALRLGTSLEDRPRYTPTTTFETFPFPEGLTPNIPAARYANDPRARRIAAAAKRLDDLRNAWLNPPDLIEIVPEVVPFYPDRILPKSAEAAVVLKSRTLTNLYNQRPQWLADAHAALDRAVAAAYGWPEDIATEDALARLLALNLERAAAQA